ncbi:MAG: PleD family two-component system response regulator [Pseudomonadota bacterium]
MTARVLVVDDVRANVELLRAKLEGRFFLVETAEDGPSGLEAAQRLLPDVILLDVMMPGINGFDVCRLLKENPATAHVPVVLVTALAERDYRLRGLDAGADDFLTKPVDDAILIARVKSLARLKSMMDEWRARLVTIRDLGVDIPQSEGSLPERPGVIAVAEADPLERELAIEALEESGHKVIDATALLSDPTPSDKYASDVLLVGLGGDFTEGLRLVSALRAVHETRGLPLLVAAPEGSSQEMAQSLEFGANDCITKPLEQAELRARVRLQLRRLRYQRLLNRRYEHGLRLAVLDELTGLHNRRYLMQHLQQLLREAEEREMPVAAAMIDIDHFKQINDGHGHGFGDYVLRAVAERISAQLRPSDTLARLGGEEFVVLMPATSEDEAVDVAERLRTCVGKEAFDVAGKELNVTISCGVALSEAAQTDSDLLLRRADQALYQAKSNGRNQTVAASN